MAKLIILICLLINLPNLVFGQASNVKAEEKIEFYKYATTGDGKRLPFLTQERINNYNEVGKIMKSVSRDSLKRIVYEMEIFTKKSGYVKVEITYKNNKRQKETKSFYTQDDVLTKREVKTGSLITTTHYDYNEEGDLLSQSTRDFENREIRKNHIVRKNKQIIDYHYELPFEWKFHDVGASVIYSDSLELNMVKISEYNEKRNLVLEKFDFLKDDYTTSNILKYNRKRHLKKEEDYENGKLKYRSIERYNLKGRNTKNIFIMFDLEGRKESVKTSKYKYKYDKNGELIRVLSFEKGQLQTKMKKEIEYKPQNQTNAK